MKTFMRFKNTALIAVAFFCLASVPRGASIHARPQTTAAAASSAESRFEVVTREGVRVKTRAARRAGQTEEGDGYKCRFLESHESFQRAACRMK